MTEGRYKITLSREGQPSHQMAEMNATMSGDILLGIVRSLIGQGEGGLDSWLTGDAPGSFNFGTFKSITITKVDDLQE